MKLQVGKLIKITGEHGIRNMGVPRQAKQEGMFFSGEPTRMVAKSLLEDLDNLKKSPSGIKRYTTL
ncbi:unnamed protein product [Thlaspi arvense]|uniref:Uncharacterized protein n=1 Tax=Thlaspi arvense TaxID=13288 RepID=A0AAU9SDL6_THLAR|nr:unnamed protein product [Thlaspi arvense]